MICTWTSRFIGVLLAIWFSSLQAAAVEVYLNGVKITGLQDQVIDGAKIVLDNRGDVHIQAPRYKVKEIDRAAQGASTGAGAVKKALSKKYYLVTEATRAGGTGRSVQIIINGRLVKELTDDLPQHIVELNAYLQPGVNSLRFLSAAKQQSPVVSPQASATDKFSLLVGEGSGQAGGTLRIKKVLAEFAVTATDQAQQSKTLTIQAR